jgi:hypothetical protein
MSYDEQTSTLVKLTDPSYFNYNYILERFTLLNLEKVKAYASTLSNMQTSKSLKNILLKSKALYKEKPKPFVRFLYRNGEINYLSRDSFAKFLT